MIVLGWIGFSRKTVEREVGRPFESKKKTTVSRYPKVYQWIARISLGIILIGVGGGVWLLFKNQQGLEANVVVLVAKFDGPEETYGLRAQIMDKLRQATQGYADTVIIDGQDIITAGQGSAYARKLGRGVKADLVIWAWYKPTENPNITIHIENLSPIEIKTLRESETYQPQSTLKELESFSIQRRLGSETSALISFLTGLSRYEASDYKSAVTRFESILQATDLSPLVPKIYILLLAGNSHLFLGDNYKAIQDYNQILQDGLNHPAALFNRAIAYAKLGQYDKALTDYNNILDSNPNNSVAYLNRADAYSNLGQYNNSVNDYTYVIQLNPNDERAYFYRASVYQKLGKTAEAEADFKKYEELTGQKP